MTQKNRFPLGELFPELNLVGDFSALKGVEIERLSSAEQANEGDLVFIAQDRLLSFLESAKPAAFVVSDALWAKASALKAKAPLLRSKDAMLAFAKVSRLFASESRPAPGIHPTAIVHPSAKIGARASIGPFAQVGEAAEVGENSVLHSHAQVGARSRVGRDCVLFAGVVLYHDVSLGDRVRIHANSVIGGDGFGYVQERVPGGVKHVKIHHLGGVKIGHDVEIGACTTVDRGTLGDTVIGNGCIIDNQVQIAHNCVLEEGVVVCGCTGLAGSAHIEKFAVLGGAIAVGNKVRVGAGAQVAGFTPVTSHVPAGAKWGGIPNMPQGDFARLQVLFKRLPELFERKKNGN
jgi:UDP-3-O-[3-hydroxymyristoyl] glucosamine N-acyltransferase